MRRVTFVSVLVFCALPSCAQPDMSREDWETFGQARFGQDVDQADLHRVQSDLWDGRNRRQRDWKQ